MNSNKINEKVKDQGIIHFWNLPNKIYIILDSKFKDKLMNEFMKVVRTKYNAKKITGIQRQTISNMINKTNQTIRINYLLKIVEVINKIEFNLESIEKHITWIGDFRSQGIISPKLPFNFNSREGARFLAAICNDGGISHNAYYCNEDKDLRESVKKDTLAIFGGKYGMIAERIKRSDHYLQFPSVIRDVLILTAGFKGVKSENNPPIPSFILNNEELICGWIEQTIADEGCVKYYPQTYRREIAWKRAYKSNLADSKLTKNEMKMLDEIGIKYDIYNAGNYKTVNGTNKRLILIRIAGRENLLKLRKLITIPHKRKNKTFTEITNGFVRYKEPLRVKDVIVKICKEKGFVNSPDLKNRLNYKNIGTAYKWLKFYSKNGLLNCVKEFAYNKGFLGRIPAKYVLK